MRAMTAMDRHTAAAVAERYERDVLGSLARFASTAAPTVQSRLPLTKGQGAAVFRRLRTPRGPLVVFGYDYFADHAQTLGIAAPKLPQYQGSWGGGEEYAFEALNFADGKHSLQQIHAQLAAEYGPVPVELITDYLQDLRRIGIIE